jgi:hypothetical protein
MIEIKSGAKATQEAWQRMAKAQEYMAEQRKTWLERQNELAALFGKPLPPTWRKRMGWKIERVRDAWLVLIGKRRVE